MSETHFKVALFGASGRMGQEIIKQAWRYPLLTIAYGYGDEDACEVIERVQVDPVPEQLPEDVKVAIDFSIAPAVSKNAELCHEQKIPFVCGVTGLDSATMMELTKLSAKIPLLYAPNMSAGMNVMFHLAAEAAKALRGYERHILETHHTAKKDAPSGSALHLAKSVEDSIKEETPITAMRIGEVVGEHKIVFGGPGERLEIIHRAESRAVFANGALRAAQWILDKPAGLYQMKDVLEM